MRKHSVSKNQRLPELNHGTGAIAKDLEYEADVLFQRIYGKWYAFSMVNDDCFVFQVSEDEIHRRMGKKAPRTC